MGEIYRKDIPVAAPEFQVENYTGMSRTVHNGGMVRELVSAVYDVSGGDSGTVAAHGLGVYIPDNAIITNAWVDVSTTFTDGASDTATIAVHVQSANDLVAAIAISDSTNVWDAGIHATKINNFALDGNALTQVAMAAARAATNIKTTAQREITVTVGTAALTAGKLRVFVEYVISD